jgi:lysophospholipase L1-like esterase
MRVICVGDSITYGQNVRADEAWPAILAQDTGWDVRNEGVCGDTTRLGLERFPKAVQLHRPDAVVIQFGHNDANIWDSDMGFPRVSPEAYVANVTEMWHRSRSAGAREVVILSPHEAPGRDRAYNLRLRFYRHPLAEDPPTVSVLDDGYGLHPDVAMHTAYAALVEERLR